MKILFPKNEIYARVKEMGATISIDYANKELILLGVLKGSALFIADLCREISVPLSIDFIRVKSYEGNISTGQIQLLLEPEKSLIQGKHILVVEDIVDTGFSLDFILDYLNVFSPASVEIATFLNKEGKHSLSKPIKYSGFAIEDKFVIGYGLDYNEQYRNLQDIMYLDL